MSVVRDLILQADDDLRYPTSGELQSMVAFLGGCHARVRRQGADGQRKEDR